MYSSIWRLYPINISSDLWYNKVGNEKLDSKDIFEEIVSLLHCYSMKMYSKRRITNLKKVIEDKEINTNDSSEN